jgi:hypothetical protein
LTFKPETQNPYELEKFLEFIREHKINVYCEIGLYAGTTFKRVYDLLLEMHGPNNFKMFGIDYPTNQSAFSHAKELLGDLPEVELYWTPSNDPKTVEAINQNLEDHAKDVGKLGGIGYRGLVFIDGDHSYTQTLEDYQIYKELFYWIAFNDVSPRTVQKNIQKHGKDVATCYHVYSVLRLNPMLEEAYFEDHTATNPRGIGILY